LQLALQTIVIARLDLLDGNSFPLLWFLPQLTEVGFVKTLQIVKTLDRLTIKTPTCQGGK
jgi:hypothetical protein